MKRRSFLAALGVTLIATLLLCTQSFSAPPPVSGVIHGTMTCSTNFVYDPNPVQLGGFALTDSPGTCTFTAKNGYALGTGTASLLMSADLDSNFMGDIWGSFTLTTANGSWWGGFEGNNSTEATAVLGVAVGHGAYKGQQMLLSIDHFMGNAGFVMEVGPLTATAVDPLGQAVMCQSYTKFVRSEYPNKGFANQAQCVDYVNSGGRLAVVDKAMPGWMKFAPKMEACLDCPGIPTCCFVGGEGDFADIDMDCFLNHPECYRR